MWYIYTMEYYSAIKKNKFMPFVAIWMEIETLILSEVCQKEKDKYCMISLISRIQYRAQMNLSTEEKMVNRLVVAKGEGEGVEGLGTWGK